MTLISYPKIFGHFYFGELLHQEGKVTSIKFYC